MHKQSAMLDREDTILATSKRDGKKYYFMICDTCFWCASLFEPDLSRYHGAFLCPVCEGSKVQSIPLASDEVYWLNTAEAAGRGRSSSSGAVSKFNQVMIKSRYCGQ